MTAKQREESTPAGEEDKKPAFASKLDRGAQRFLAHVMVHAHEIGRRAATDFIRHFPPADIMSGLESRPHLRADILEVATGLKRKIALKKSSGSAGEDLQIALDEEVCTADEVVEAFKPDDRVRYLDNKKLWAYVIDGEFWKVEPKQKKEHARAKEHVAFMLDRALADKLISHQDLVEGVSVDTLAESLPRPLLARVINAALELGKGKKVFTEEHLLDVAGAQMLVEEVSLEHIWETVVMPKIAAAHGLAEPPADEEEPADAKEESDKAKRAEAPPPRAASKPAKPAEKAAKGSNSKAAAGAPKANSAAKENGAAKDKRAAEDGAPTQQEELPADDSVDVVEIMEMEEEEFEERTDPGIRTAPQR